MTQHGARRKSTAEWVTLSLSVLVVGAIIVVALIEESRRLDGEDAALQVTIDTERVTARGESFYVPNMVQNTGSDAVSSAETWIDVYEGARLVASAEINLQFLPLQGKQDGVFVTTQDPASQSLRSRIESLQFPQCLLRRKRQPALATARGLARASGTKGDPGSGFLWMSRK